MAELDSNVLARNVVYFRIIAIIIPIVFIVIIELLLRVFSVRDNVNLFISHPNKNYKEYYTQIERFAIANLLNRLRSCKVFILFVSPK
jgi:hypothetical protein